MSVGVPGRGLATAAMVVAIVAIALSGIMWIGYGVQAVQAAPSYGI